jgi:translation initiation factor 2B subunit (eIF-2B alpha/beta/delta family)
VNAWDQIRRAASDRRSGSVEIALRAAEGLGGLDARRDVLRAARALLRAHPAMAILWRLLAETLDAPEPGRAAQRFADRLRAETEAAADGVRWVVTRRANVVFTHSASSSVVLALRRVSKRVERVICSASLPGGEGRAVARRLERDGFAVEVVPDAAIAQACARADVALVGADAVTEKAAVNKVGTRLVALAARDAGIGCYALASTAKMLPEKVWARVHAPLYEATPLSLLDAVVTERGALRPGAVRHAVGRVRIPPELQRMIR